MFCACDINCILGCDIYGVLFWLVGENTYLEVVCLVKLVISVE